MLPNRRVGVDVSTFVNFNCHTILFLRCVEQATNKAFTHKQWIRARDLLLLPTVRQIRYFSFYKYNYHVNEIHTAPTHIHNTTHVHELENGTKIIGTKISDAPDKCVHFIDFIRIFCFRQIAFHCFWTTMNFSIRFKRRNTRDQSDKNRFCIDDSVISKNTSYHGLYGSHLLSVKVPFLVFIFYIINKKKNYISNIHRFDLYIFCSPSMHERYIGTNLQTQTNTDTYFVLNAVSHTNERQNIKLCRLCRSSGT